MFKIFNLDKALRFYISSVFRVCILTYSAIILNLQSNYFSWYWYGLASFIYGIIFSLLRKKEGWKSKARLLSDYLFITFILWGKSFTFLNISLLLLPLFNAPNHSGEKRSIVIYFFLIIFGAILFKPSLALSDIIPLGFIVILNWFEIMRARMIRFAAFLQETLDEFYLNYFNFHKSHILYKELIKKLNGSKFQQLYTIDNILCFVKKENRVIIVNGSVFIWTYDLSSITETDYGNLEKKQMLKDKLIVVNDKTYAQNSIFQVSAQGEKYIYVINHAKRGIFYLISPFYINRLVRPLFHKIAETIYLERSLRIFNNENIKRIKNKLVYVNNATLAMHFLRNKMSPIIGYFETLDLIKKERKEDDKTLQDFLNKFREKARPALNDILSKANMILEKSDNPFVISNFTVFSTKKIFDTTRKIWIEYFDTSQISFKWDISETLTHSQFELNEEYLGIVFTDIIRNMETYNKGIAQLEFDEQPESFIIRFKNNFDPSTRIETERICIDFMSEENEEINKRITHGLTMIKSFIRQLSINYNLYTLDNLFIFELYFNKV